jgi:hypothetical protein
MEAIVGKCQDLHQINWWCQARGECGVLNGESSHPVVRSAELIQEAAK